MRSCSSTSLFFSALFVGMASLFAVTGCSGDDDNGGTPPGTPDGGPGDAGNTTDAPSSPPPATPPTVSADSSFAAGTGISDTKNRLYAAAPGPNGVTYVALRTAGGAIGWGKGTLLRRYLADGSLDAAFATGGELSTTLVANPAGLAVDETGRILVGGSGLYDPDTSTDTGQEIVILRVTAAGAVDGSYGSGGRSKLKLSTANNYSTAIHARSDGGALLSVRGRSNGKDYYGSFLVGATGGAISDFGTSGYLSSTLSTNGALTLTDDSLVPSNTALIRYGADGKSKGTAIEGRITSVKSGKDGALTAIVTEGQAAKLARYSATGVADANFAATPLPDGYRDFAVLDDGSVFFSDATGLSWVSPKGGTSTSVVKDPSISRLTLSAPGKLLVTTTGEKVVRFVF